MNISFAPVWSQKLTSFATIVAILTLSVSVMFAAPTSAYAAATGSLVPVGDGNYTDWDTGNYTDVNEGTGGSPACDSSDSVIENSSNERNSFEIDISSIPDGSLIQSVAVSVVDRGDSTSGGTYQTFVRVDGTNTDSGSNLTATGGSGDPCSSVKSQNIDFTDVVKSGATTFEVGVLKTSGNTNTVRVGAISVVITYVAGVTAGPNAATSGANCVDDSSIGTKTWSNTGNVLTSNNVYASSTVDDNQISHYIKCSNFGFSIPGGATIAGVVAGVERKVDSVASASQTLDYSVRLVKGGTITGSNRATSNDYTTSDVTEDHGSASDLWGTTLTPSDVNASNFGVAFAAQKSGNNGTARVVSVDRITLTVYYYVNGGDVTAPTLAVVTPVTTPTNDNTPNFTFSSTEAGSITYGGDCSSATGAASAGNNTITFNALSDGAHTNCTVTVTDASLNASSALAVPSFTVDTAAPILSESVAVPTPTNDNTPSYTFNSSEAGTISYTGCSSATTAAVSGSNVITFNTLSDGLHACTLKVTDAAGNQSATLDMSDFTVDTDGPSLSLSWGVSNPTNVSPISVTATFGESVTDFDSGDISVTNGTAGTVSGGPTVYTFDVTPAGDGLVQVSVASNKAQDAATNGNDASNTLSTNYDGSVPSVTITGGPLESAYTNDNETDFTFIDSGATAIECQVDGGGYSVCSSPFTTSVLTDGAHTFNVRASDGINATSTATRNFNVDTTRPEPLFGATISDPNSDALTHVAVTFSSPVINFVAGDLTVGNATIENFSGSGTTYGFDLAPIADGLVTLDMAENVADEANGSGNGNTAPLLSISYVYDTTPPVIDAHSDETVEVVYANSAVVNYTAPDAIDAVDGTFAATCSPVSGSTFAYGDTLVTCDATDVSGNAASQTSFTVWVIDTTGPSLSVVTPIPGTTESHQPDLVFSTDENGSVAVGGGCSSSATSATVGNNNIALNFLFDGTYSACTITVTDGAGNASVLPIPEFTINSTPAPVSTGGAGGGNGLFSLTNNSSAPGTIPGSVLGAFTTQEEQSQSEGQVLGDSAFTFLVNLSYGMTNSDVTELQKVLIKLGLLKIAAPTGWFGPMTLAAVKQFQTDHGIPSTGFVGPLTRAALNALSGQ